MRCSETAAPRELLNLLHDEARLAVLVLRFDQLGHGPARFAGEEVLGVFLLRALDDDVGQIQDGLRRCGSSPPGR